VSAVIHRTTLQYLPSVNEPDYPEPTWKWNPNMTAVAGVDPRYWKAPADWAGDAGPVEMSQAEKDAVDLAADIAGQETLTWRMAIKLAGTTRNTNTTVADDPDLTFPVYPGEAYRFRGLVWYTTTAAGDFKYTLSGPASPAGVIIERSVVLPAATAYSGIGITTAFGGAGLAATGTSAGIGRVRFEGAVTVGATAGAVTFQWAQNTSDAGPTTVLRGSYLEWARVPQ
jgi:hypothetical protein